MASNLIDREYIVVNSWDLENLRRTRLKQRAGYDPYNTYDALVPQLTGNNNMVEPGDGQVVRRRVSSQPVTALGNRI